MTKKNKPVNIPKTYKTLEDTGRDIYTARLAARERFKFLGTALWAMIPVITEAVPTLAVDRYWRLYINPNFFAACDIASGAACLVHEVWHLLSKHAERSDALLVSREEMELLNICQDAEINQKDDLHVDLAKTPVQPIMPANFEWPENLLFEEYWELMKTNIKKVSVNILMPGGGNCGSGAHGKHGEHPWDQPAPSVGKTKKPDETPGITKAQANVIIDHTARNIIEASKNAGNVPAGWLRWAETIVDPKVDWRQELPVAIHGAIAPATGHAFPTYRRMSRRQQPDIVKPGHLASMPNVDIVIDTSGSMSDLMICQGIAEVDGILLALGSQINVSVYFTDCAAAPVQSVRSTKDLRPIGGGGTDMNRGWDAIIADISNGTLSQPDLIICVTDGYTPWPANPPLECKHVILVLTDDGTAPTWAKQDDDHNKLIRCDVNAKAANAA